MNKDFIRALGKGEKGEGGRGGEGREGGLETTYCEQCICDEHLSVFCNFFNM